MFLFDKKPTKKSLYKELLPTVPLFQIFFSYFCQNRCQFQCCNGQKLNIKFHTNMYIKKRK